MIAHKPLRQSGRASAPVRLEFMFRWWPNVPDWFAVLQLNLHSAVVLMLGIIFNITMLGTVFVANARITRWNAMAGALVMPLTGLLQVRSIADAE